MAFSKNIGSCWECAHTPQHNYKYEISCDNCTRSCRFRTPGGSCLPPQSLWCKYYPYNNGIILDERLAPKQCKMATPKK